ncbi:MAG: hypothetical protein IJR98_04725, partial [Synergistaceae bacterium]|nr:hypothetical protein [Synergistaceae bacterium]
GQDLYSIAMAEYDVQHPREGYPDSWWDLLDDEIGERFDKIPEADQRKLKKRMSAFASSISEYFEELDELAGVNQDEDEENEEFDDDDNDYDEIEREKERRRIINDIYSNVVDEFSDFLIED